MAKKQSPQKQAQKTKDLIIVAVLDFVQTKNESYKKTALKMLEELAIYYNVPARRKLGVRNSLFDDLKEFILESKGYMDTIPYLYKSLEDKKWK